MNKVFFISAFIFVSTLSTTSYASQLEIIDVKRNITLSENDPVYKDYYIKVGSKSDLKKNQVVKAVRTISVKDASLKPIGDFNTTVGLIKIIQISDTIAVGREFKLTPRDDEPMLEQIGIMVGDSIDTADSFTDTTKRKPAEAKLESTPSMVAPVVAPATPNIENNSNPATIKAEVTPAAQDI